MNSKSSEEIGHHPFTGLPSHPPHSVVFFTGFHRRDRRHPFPLRFPRFLAPPCSPWRGVGTEGYISRGEWEGASDLRNWNSERILPYTPYLQVDKYDILQDGLQCCDKLGVEFDEVYKRTNTSYKPTAEGYSDYKSASSVERIEAFIKLGRPDPVQYADESGVVDWDIARGHVESVLAEYAE